MSELWFILILVVFVLPWVTYISVKVGTYGYLKGRQQFFENEEKENGKN